MRNSLEGMESTDRLSVVGFVDIATSWVTASSAFNWLRAVECCESDEGAGRLTLGVFGSPVMRLRRPSSKPPEVSPAKPDQMTLDV